MLAAIPFVYDETVVLPRRMKPVTRNPVGHVRFEVPEISLSETTPAARWTYGRGDWEKSMRRPVAIRRWNGRLIRQVFSEHASDGRHPAPAVFGDRGGYRQLGWHVDAIYGLWRYDDRSAQVRDAFLSEDRAPKQPGRLIASTEQEHAETVGEVARSLVSVDRQVWQTVPWAALSVRSSPRETADVWATVGPYGYRPDDRRHIAERKRSPVTTWRFDLRLLRSMPGRYPQPGTGLMVYDLEIEDGDAIAYNGKADFTARVMDYAVLHSESDIGKAGSDRVKDWVRMREAVSVNLADPLADIPADAVASLREFADNMDNEQGEVVRQGVTVMDRYSSVLASVMGEEG